MFNMMVNKVVFNGNPIIDITDTKFEESFLPQGSVVYNSAGERIEGRAIVQNVYTDTTENWNSKLSYIPLRGDVIIYSDNGQITDQYGETINVPGVKIGDGNAYLIDLPFVGADIRYQILTELRTHTNNAMIHITDAERQFWNNKLNCTVNNCNLIFNRL